MKLKLSGAEIFVECLKKEGVKAVFGIPGGVVLGIFDALYKQDDIDFLLTRHEQGAVHMADGYARVTGKPGVALVTSGPGATNTITGIATAYMDSIPLIVFTGQVATDLIGNDAFQEADIIGISRPCTKYNYLVKDVNDLPRIIKEAFYIAGSGRPGPVLIDLPKNVMADTTTFSYPETVSIRSYTPTYQGNALQIKRALEAILKAERPIFYVGGGTISSNASTELAELIDIVDCPVTMTLLGLGAFSGTDRRSLGMLGMHGTYWANMAIHNSDLIVAVGVRFDDRVTGRISGFAPNAHIIHIDIDPTSIRKNVRVDIPIVGDIKHVLQDMIKFVGPMVAKAPVDRKQWYEEIKGFQQSCPLNYEESDEISVPQLIETLYNITGGDAILATDVGQHQMWAAQYFKLKESRTFLTSGGLGTMGFGLPAALGAQKAFPEKLVLCISGDGSLQMNIQELAVAVLYKLPVKIILANNGHLGMVRQWQSMFFDKRYSGSVLHTRSDNKGCPDFVKLAEAYGATGLRATKKSDMESVLRQGLETDGPVLMDFHVNPDEKVMPMVPPGGSIDEMILEFPD